MNEEQWLSCTDAAEMLLHLPGHASERKLRLLAAAACRKVWHLLGDARSKVAVGTLDPNRLAVLADALEEAGCTDAEILSHLRGQGPHVRGCLIVDLLLGKE